MEENEKSWTIKIRNEIRDYLGLWSQNWKEAVIVTITAICVFGAVPGCQQLKISRLGHDLNTAS